MSNDERKRPALPKAHGDSFKRAKISNGDGFKLRKLGGKRGEFTRVNDEVHKTIDICPVTKAILDTEPMQRLRRIHQLGTSSLVYPNATHSRFEHSLGVAHLAKCFAQRVSERQPSLGTTRKDVLCCQLAGLLHDVGHGPYSHIFEKAKGMIAEKAEGDEALLEIYKTYDENFERHVRISHEETSLEMIDLVLSELGLEIDLDNLDKPLRQIGDGIDAKTLRAFDHSPEDGNRTENILTSRDFVFVKESIFGKPIPQVEKHFGKKKLIGREEPYKEWLYDVVCNRFSGLDVDKMDYYARDLRRCNGEAGNVDIPMVTEAIVGLASCHREDCAKCKPIGGGYPQRHYMICYPEKHVRAVLSFFQTRLELHSKIYQHKTTSAAAFMIGDILALADIPFAKVLGVPLSLAPVYPKSFCKLADSIIDIIRLSDSDNFRPARELAERYSQRKLYKFCGEQVVKDGNSLDNRRFSMPVDQIVKELLTVGFHGEQEGDQGTKTFLDAQDIIVEKCAKHCGHKDQSPLLLVRFIPSSSIRNDHPSDPRPLEAIEVDQGDYQTYLPRSFQTKSIRVYCRDPAKVDLLTHIFDQWKADGVNPTTAGHQLGYNSGTDDTGSYVLQTLTQDSLDSPAAGRRSCDENSPSPILKRRRSK